MLKKFWKSLRRSSNDPVPAAPESAEQSGASVAIKKRGTESKPATGKSRTGRILGIGGHQPHRRLAKMIKRTNASSVLEIGVGDGSRAVAVTETLSGDRSEKEILYAAIDLFEMGGGGNTTLKDFHQTLRGSAAKAKVFPGEVEPNLPRVAHTIGPVDLILISAEAPEFSHPLLAKVTHETTVVLAQHNDSWHEVTHNDAGRRAA